MDKIKILLPLAILFLTLGLTLPYSVRSATDPALEGSSQPVFSNCAVTKIGTPATEPVLPPECAIGAGGAIPSADRATALRELKTFIDSGKIKFANNINDQTGLSNVDGRGIINRTSEKGGGEVMIDTVLIRSMVYLAGQGYTFTITSIVGNHDQFVKNSNPPRTSQHWHGKGYDIGAINGVAVRNPAAKADTIKVMQLFNSLKDTDLIPRQVICTGNGRLDDEVIKLTMNNSVLSPGFFAEGHDNHIHVGY